jgi:hypothetical protein
MIVYNPRELIAAMEQNPYMLHGLMGASVELEVDGQSYIGLSLGATIKANNAGVLYLCVMSNGFADIHGSIGSPPCAPDGFSFSYPLDQLSMTSGGKHFRFRSSDNKCTLKFSPRGAKQRNLVATSRLLLPMTPLASAIPKAA